MDNFRSVRVTHVILGGAVTRRRGFVKCLLRVPQLIYSFPLAKASKGNSQATVYNISSPSNGPSYFTSVRKKSSMGSLSPSPIAFPPHIWHVFSLSYRLRPARALGSSSRTTSRWRTARTTTAATPSTTTTTSSKPREPRPPTGNNLMQNGFGSSSRYFFCYSYVFQASYGYPI